MDNSFIPAPSAEPGPRTSSEQPPPEVRPSRAVLLVEDDPLVLMATADTLASFGLPVAEAATGSEAKEKLRAAGAEASSASVGEVGVAIVDIGLPDLAGTDLVGELRHLCPGLPVIVASGYDREMLESHFGDDAGVHYLQKPYTVAALETLLRRVGVLPP